MTGPLYRERHSGPPARTQTEIGGNVWGGILALFRCRQGKSWWAEEFPDECPDGQGTCGLNFKLFSMALEAYVPDIDLTGKTVPDTLAMLDFLEFCSKHISRPIRGREHSFFKHVDWHEFDQGPALEEWRDTVEALFRANGIAYRINVHGECERVPEVGLETTLVKAQFKTGDPALDQLLAEARSRFLAPRPGNYQDAAEKLWDAFERLKTLEDPDKAKGIGLLITKSAATPASADLLDREARNLTDIGNNYRIRHHETTKAALTEDEYRYLFQCLYALVHQLLGQTGRLA